MSPRSDTPAGCPVAAALTDAAIAPAVARHAARWAPEQQPIVLLIPLVRVGLSLDPVVLDIARRRRERHVTSVLVEAAPWLLSRDGPVSWATVDCRRLVRDRAGSLAVALATAAAVAGARVLVAPAAVAVRVRPGVGLLVVPVGESPRNATGVDNSCREPANLRRNEPDRAQRSVAPWPWPPSLGPPP